MRLIQFKQLTHASLTTCIGSCDRKGKLTIDLHGTETVLRSQYSYNIVLMSWANNCANDNIDMSSLKWLETENWLTVISEDGSSADP